MRINRLSTRIALLALLVLALTILSTRHYADTGTCGGQSITLPFTDVIGSQFFCQIAEAYFCGLANGTSPTTYNPTGNVNRDQMAAFMTRTQDSALRRGSKRAALQQFWTTTPRYDSTLGGLGTTNVDSTPEAVASDGADLWVTNRSSGTVSRVRASDGKLLDT